MGSPQLLLASLLHIVRSDAVCSPLTAMRPRGRRWSWRTPPSIVTKPFMDLLCVVMKTTLDIMTVLDGRTPREFKLALAVVTMLLLLALAGQTSLLSESTMKCTASPRLERERKTRPRHLY